MKKHSLLLCIGVYVGMAAWAQNVGIGTTNPLARLSVDGSIMVDQENSNQGNLSQGSLYFGSDKRVGIVRSFFIRISWPQRAGLFYQ